MKDFEEFYEAAINNIPDDTEIDIPHVGEVRDLDDDFFEGYAIDEEGTSIDDYKKDHENYHEPLTDDDRRAIDGAIRSPLGFEVLAFYKSRRLRDRKPYVGKWGIFYLSVGIDRIAELLMSRFGSSLPEFKARQLSRSLIQQHERFHYKFDIHALTIESLLKKNLYLPLKRAFRHHPHHQIEEGLANSMAYTWSKSPRNRFLADFGDFVSEFMSLQPAAYARFNEKKKDMFAELNANLIDNDISASARRRDPNLWVGNLQWFGPKLGLPPEYIITPKNISLYLSPYALWEIPKLDEIVETSQFMKYFKKHPTHKELWIKVKEKLLSNYDYCGLHAKRLAGRSHIWSVRIQGKNLLAHLHPPAITGKSGSWEAFKIGDHKEMGHG